MLFTGIYRILHIERERINFFINDTGNLKLSFEDGS